MCHVRDTLNGVLKFWGLSDGGRLDNFSLMWEVGRPQALIPSETLTGPMLFGVVPHSHVAPHELNKLRVSLLLNQVSALSPIISTSKSTFSLGAALCC